MGERDRESGEEPSPPRRTGAAPLVWPEARAGLTSAGRALALRPPRWLEDHADAAHERLRGWLAVEAGAGRLVLWCPVAMGAGIAVYFSAGQEPALWAALGLLAACAVAVVLLRRQSFAFLAAVLVMAAAAGFAAATVRSVLVAHPVLDRPLFGATVSGWIVERAQRERSDRIVVDVDRIEAPRFDGMLTRVRVSIRKGTAPPVGSYVSFKARLSPPLGPLRPGGYDFARDLYFKGIGASGFALGRVERIDAPAAPSWDITFATAVEHLRNAIDTRIRSIVPGDTGTIASALITGKRDAITQSVNEAMFVSSLGHVLSISGYHMAVVAGVVFFATRGLLALSMPLATRRPIKKWSALVALAAASFYLLLSGAEIATQRAYVMTAIVLVGVLLDRPALTLRTLAVAALGLLLLFPEALVHPSFQMSFAATLALIAAYERGLPWMVAGAGTPLGARVALWGGREILGAVLCSLVAGTATTLFAAYHFHRLAPYGVIANLLAMPVVSAWVMPTGLLGLVAMPFGFDAPLWRMMGFGVDWMIAVAERVAALPGAVGEIAAFGVGPLVAATAGLLIVCLLRSPLRWGGIAVAAVAVVFAARTPQPDVLIAPEAEVVAVRGADGAYTIRRIGSNSFAVRQFLASDGDARAGNPADPKIATGFSCDAAGCIAALPDGRRVAVALTAEAFDEDCRKAAVIVTRRTAPPDCAALVVDRTLWPKSGALALRRDGEGFAVTMARPPGIGRPWAPDRHQPPPVAEDEETAPSVDLGPDD